MKRMVLSLCIFFLLVTTAFAKCEQLANAMANHVEESTEATNEILEMFDPPDREALENCLRGFSLSDAYSLGLPSLSSIFQAICKEINAATREQIRELQDSLTYEPLPGFEISSKGAVTQDGSILDNLEDGVEYDTDVRVNTNSGSRAREILDLIREQ